MILCSPRSFFASRNTVFGFHNDFSRVFDPSNLNQIFIMKGGPGTGKSSFMREIAKFAEKNNITVDFFHCSSDPASLDGIILREIKIAIIDGTSPHTADPKFPGVIENIINLGNFWDIAKLSENKAEIIRLIKEKTKHYKRAYQFLSAYGEIANELFLLSKSNLFEKKLNENAQRQIEKVMTKKSDGSELCRNISTFSAEGQVFSESFEFLSKKIWIIEDHLFSAHLYLNKILEIAKKNNQSVWKSSSPTFLDFPNALYFPDSKCSFIIKEKNYDTELPQKEYHYINMKRFLDMEKIKLHKQKNKFGYKCLAMLLDGATEAFSEAKEVHKSLESYYIKAMNFDKINDLKNTVKEMVLQKIEN